MPQVLIDAIVATEDSRFFQHNGFDAARFIKASASQLIGHGGGGASTLTMQISKNAYTDTVSSGFEGIKENSQIFTYLYLKLKNNIQNKIFLNSTLIHIIWVQERTEYNKLA